MQLCLIINVLRAAISSLVDLDVQLEALLWSPPANKTKWSRLQVGIASQDLNKAGPETVGSQRSAARAQQSAIWRRSQRSKQGDGLSHWRRRDIFSHQNWQGGWTRAGRGTKCWPWTHRVCLCVIWTVRGLRPPRGRGFRDVARRVLILIELVDKSGWTEAALLKVRQPSVTKKVWLHHKVEKKTVWGHQTSWFL